MSSDEDLLFGSLVLTGATLVLSPAEGGRGLAKAAGSVRPLPFCGDT